MPKTDSPKDNAEKLNTIRDAWQSLASGKTFYGKTLAQFENAIKPSFDKRARIEELEDLLRAAQGERDAADVQSLDLADHVVDSVVADPDYGDDSELYGAMGYVRKSERKSGLTRKTKPPTT